MESRALFNLRIADFFKAATRGTGGVIRPLKLAEAALFQKRQAGRRRKAAGKGLTVPPILIASLTRKCNLHCEGCYSRELRPQQSDLSRAEPELSDDRFMVLFGEAIALGVSIILLAGGEPLLRRKLVEKASKLPGMIFPLFTNGTLLDEDFLTIAREGSVVPILSIEGEAAETDGRRGLGVHAGTMRWMEEMRRRGIMFGASVTLSSKNAHIVLDRRFLEGLEAKGIAVLFIIEFVPVRSGTDSLIVNPEQRAMLNDDRRFNGLPFPVVALPGDEAAYGGCLAAGRGFVHLSPEGLIEACPFAPFSDRDVKSGSLENALRSPLLAAIRERHGELTETRGGCALWNKGGWIAALGACGAAASSSGGVASKT